MQGHGSSVSCDRSDGTIDSQFSWNDTQNSLQTEYQMSSIEMCLHPSEHRSSGESSSASAAGQPVDEHTRRIHPQSAPDCHVELPDTLSSENARVNHTENCSSRVLPCDLNVLLQLEDDENEEPLIFERPNTYVSTGASHGELPSDVGFSSGNRRRYEIESQDIPGSSLGDRHRLCKRRALEVHAGSSSGAGSSNWFQNSVPATQIVQMPAPTSLVLGNESSQANSQLGLGVGRAAVACPFPLNPGTNAESSWRNLRMPLRSSQPLDSVFWSPLPTETEAGNSDDSSRAVSRSRSLDMNPPSERRSLQRQPVPLHQNPQSRWIGSSSSVSGISAEESASRLHHRTMYENDMPLPAHNMWRSIPPPINWNLSVERSAIAGNIEFASRGVPTSWNNSYPNASHRSSPQYSQRLSEMVRRSLISTRGIESGNRSSNRGIRLSSSASLGIPVSSESSNFSRSSSGTRAALLERHADAVLGIPYSFRGLAAAGEGRANVMSEIHHVLDLMRRGEGLRFEDLMVLDHSIFGMAGDIHDRHRDMRLDVDSMSYEELLALEERIGNVCTGLKEETILNSLKQQKYSTGNGSGEICSICREEYNDGESMGIVDCGHDFHRDCIKQWLLLKNLCPICKTTALAA